MQNSRIYIGKVAGLSKDDILPICQKVGEVRDFMLKENYAFAEFLTENDATQAIMELDGRQINGIRIFAEYAKKKSDLDEQYFSQHPRIYVGRLPSSITKQDILSEFGKFGEILDVLKKDDFAFIEYKAAESAQQSIQAMNGFQVGANRIVVEGARPKDQPGQIEFPRLYIGKLGANLKKKDIVDVFGQYGEIIDVLMKDDYCFLEYPTTICAARAIAEQNGSRINGTKIVVEEAKPKDGEVQLKRLSMKSKIMMSNTLDKSQAAVITGGMAGVRGRRLSPRRSISRSRSRSQEK